MPGDIIPTLHGYRYRHNITAATQSINKICGGVLNFIHPKFHTHIKKDGSVVNAIKQQHNYGHNNVIFQTNFLNKNHIFIKVLITYKLKLVCYVHTHTTTCTHTFKSTIGQADIPSSSRYAMSNALFCKVQSENIMFYF